MKISKNAEVVLERRYLTRDEEGNLIETPEDLFRRVSAALAAQGASSNASCCSVLSRMVIRRTPVL